MPPLPVIFVQNHSYFYFNSQHMQASYGGEDAYFISQQDGCAFGVADGVGGWANSGINPAGLAQIAAKQVKSSCSLRLSRQKRGLLLIYVCIRTNITAVSLPVARSCVERPTPPCYPLHDHGTYQNVELNFDMP